MDRTAQRLQEQARADRRVLTQRTGTVLAVLNGGRRLQVRVDGQTINVPGDRTRPAPGPGPVTLGYADGQYTVLAFPFPTD